MSSVFLFHFFIVATGKLWSHTCDSPSFYFRWTVLVDRQEALLCVKSSLFCPSPDSAFGSNKQHPCAWQPSIWRYPPHPIFSPMPNSIPSRTCQRLLIQGMTKGLLLCCWTISLISPGDLTELSQGIQLWFSRAVRHPSTYQWWVVIQLNLQKLENK